MTEFGNHNTGSLSGIAADFVQVSGPYTPASAGLLTDIFVYLAGSALGGTQAIRALIYRDNAGTPGNLVAVSSERVIDGAATAAYVDFTFATLIDARAYWLGFHAGVTDGKISSGTPSNGTRYYVAATYPNTPSSFGTPTGSDTLNHGVYGVYTTTPGGGASVGLPEGPPPLWNALEAPGFRTGPPPPLWNKASD